MRYSANDEELRFCQFMCRLLGLQIASETGLRYPSGVYSFRKKKKNCFSKQTVFYFKDLMVNNDVLGFQKLCNEFNAQK